MIQLIHGVQWPPGYYIWRDRIPFFLSILYILYRDPPRYMAPQIWRAWGLYLTASTAFATGIALGLYLDGKDMYALAGIRWSAPSPIEWGTLILCCTVTLYSRGIHIYESFYLSFITAMGGGWLYEIAYSIPHWVNGGFAPWNWMKINAVKVFFIEFQVFCIPILLYIIKKTKTYKNCALLYVAIIGAIIFYGLGPNIAPYIHRLGKTAYMWTLRVPTIIVLYSLITGIQGNNEEANP